VVEIALPRELRKAAGWREGTIHADRRIGDNEIIHGATAAVNGK
jgi:hypothetical protein